MHRRSETHICCSCSVRHVVDPIDPLLRAAGSSSNWPRWCSCGVLTRHCSLHPSRQGAHRKQSPALLEGRCRLPWLAIYRVYSRWLGARMPGQQAVESSDRGKRDVLLSLIVFLPQYELQGYKACTLESLIAEGGHSFPCAGWSVAVPAWAHAGAFSTVVHQVMTPCHA